MAQDLGFIPFKPEETGEDLGFIPAGQQKEPTWGQSIISNILGTGPAIIGGVGGALAGGPVGGALGGMAGGGLGSHWRQQYEISQGLRPEYNPYLTALDVGLGALPGITKAPASMALKELGKYGLKTAAESAVIGGVSAPAYAKAETGEWDISPRNILQSAAVGGVTGGVLGPTVHVGVNRLPARAIPPATEEAAAQTRAALPPEFQTPQVEESPPVVSARGMSAAELSMWQNKGYKPIGPDAQGYPQLGRPDVAPLYRAPIAAEPTAPIVPEESPFGPDRVIPGDEVPVPTGRANLSYIEEMRKGGYVVDRTDATTTYFKKVDEGISDEGPLISEAALSPEDVRANLTRMMGREPTPEELERSMSRQAGLGEETGRVAEFDRGFIPEEDQPQPVPPELLQPFLDEMRRTTGAERPPVFTTTRVDYGEGIPLTRGQIVQDYENLRRALENPNRGVPVTPDDLQTLERYRRRIDRWDVEHPPVEQSVIPPGTTQWPPETGLLRAPARQPEAVTQQPGLPELGPVPARTAVDDLRARARMEQMGAAPEQIDLFGQPPQISEAREPSTLERMSSLRARMEGRNFVSEATGIPPEDFVRMEVGDRVAVLRNMQGQYADHGARVANKELLQNAIDATPTGGTIDVEIDYHGVGGKDPSITVRDNGPGLNLDLLKNEYVTLTGSGKRGVVSPTGRKTIGEMGVGKATYLLGTDAFEISTVAREADGSTWKYELAGNPDSMIGEDTAGNLVPPSQIVKTRMPDGTPTGTEVKVYDKDKKNLDAAENYLKTFAEYSDSPVTVNLKGNRYLSQSMQSSNLSRTVTPRTTPAGAHVFSGSAPGGDFSISVPPTAKWKDNVNSTVAIITSRGMFQGSEEIYLAGRGRMPDRIILNVEPTVSAQDKSYPLTSPTRERMKGPFRAAVTSAVDTHLMKAARAKQEADIQSAFDALVPQPNPRNPGKMLSFVTNDRGGRYTPQELEAFNGNPRIQTIGSEMESMLRRLDSLFPTEQQSKTVKFGFDLADKGAGGINIRNPSNIRESTILINALGAMEQAPNNPLVAAERIAHTVLHEFNHNIVGEEGAGFTWSFIDVDSKFGTVERAEIVNEIYKAITGPDGKYAPDVQALLQQHIAARGRPDTTIDFVARQKEGRFAQQPRQGGIPPGGGNVGAGTPPTGPVRKKESWARQILHAPRGLMATWDFSAPMRQALPMIGTKAWWTSWAPMFSSWMKEGNYQAIINEIKSRPEFRRPFDPATGRFGKSLADEAGLRLTDINGDLTAREENTIGGLLEKLPGVRRSNRAYTAYLNSLRADAFRALLDDAEKIGMRPRRDLVLSRNIAEFVNNASGRGSLGRFEQNAKLMADVFFSPRLLASRVNMLNPATYLQAPPFVRKQYLKAFLSTIGAWGTIAGLASMAGADVSTDPESADFGKIRIGNTRIDPAGGFQQYMVAAWRLLSGSTKTSGKRYETGSGFPAPTRLDIAQNFLSNKLNPVANFVYDIANATKQRPAYGGDRMLQMFIPMIAGDLYELWRKGEYDLMPLVGATTAVGMGTATYERGKEESVFIPQRSDPWKMEGGQIPFVSDVMQDIRRAID